MLGNLDSRVPDDFDPVARRVDPNGMFQSLRLKTDVVILENDDSWGGHNLQMARLVPSSKLACADKLTQTEHVLMEGSVFDCSNLNAERMATTTVPLA